MVCNYDHADIHTYQMTCLECTDDHNDDFHDRVDDHDDHSGYIDHGNNTNDYDVTDNK